MAIQIGRSYRHFKGAIYIAVVRANDADTQEPLVVYTTGQDQQYWVRKVTNFEEEVLWPDGIKRPRFVLVEE